PVSVSAPSPTAADRVGQTSPRPRRAAPAQLLAAPMDLPVLPTHLPAVPTHLPAARVEQATSPRRSPAACPASPPRACQPSLGCRDPQRLRWSGEYSPRT